MNCKSKFRKYYDALPPRTVVAPKAEFVREIADLCKVHKQTVHCWLAGTQQPDALRRSLIAKRVGIPENELFN